MANKLRHYVGSPKHLRTVDVMPFVADPDWVGDPSQGEPADELCLLVPALRTGSGAAVSRFVLTFVFLDNSGVRQANTAAVVSVQPIFTVTKKAYGLEVEDPEVGDSVPGFVHPAGAAVVDYDVTDPLVFNVPPNVKVTVQLNAVTPPAGGRKLAIALQEIT